MFDYIYDIIKCEATSLILYLSMKKVCSFLICRQISKKFSQLISRKSKKLCILIFCSSPIKLKILQSSYFQTDWFNPTCISFGLHLVLIIYKHFLGKSVCVYPFSSIKKDDRLDLLFDRFKLILTWRTLLAPTVWSNKARTSVASWRVSATFAEAAGINSISMIFTPTTSPWWGVPRTPTLLLLKCGLLTSKVWQTEVMLFLI